VPPNSNPVGKVGLKIEFVTCDGVVRKTNTSWDEVLIGCKMYCDTTPKDAKNQRTTPVGLPEWTFDPPSLVAVNYTDPYAPVATALDPGELVVVSEIDGVKSKPYTVKRSIPQQ
jgi:hypothetical protein